MDYKIVAKAILLRLGSVMADVIHPDQTYTVPGRSIFDNLFLVRDLLELGRRDGLSFALLSLDQEKAFDRVDHGYLLSTLQAFGFGPQFVSFLRVLYASAECLVRLNWTLTEPVSFGRGVRQGCPLSGQLYALAIEPFLCLLRRRMTGLVLREPELRLVLSAYADDVLLVVQDPGDLARVEACQAIYSAASSARVNCVKSSGLAVGDWRQLRTPEPCLVQPDMLACCNTDPVCTQQGENIFRIKNQEHDKENSMQNKLGNFKLTYWLTGGRDCQLLLQSRRDGLRRHKNILSSSEEVTDQTLGYASTALSGPASWLSASQAAPLGFMSDVLKVVMFVFWRSASSLRLSSCGQHAQHYGSKTQCHLQYRFKR
ncbi:unnamed protein product [Caretta caretta]